MSAEISNNNKSQYTSGNVERGDMITSDNDNNNAPSQTSNSSNNNNNNNITTQRSNCDNDNNNNTAAMPQSNKTQKNKKRRDQKTFDLFELFDKHQSSVGNWADAALENSFRFPDQSPLQQTSSFETSVKGDKSYANDQLRDTSLSARDTSDNARQRVRQEQRRSSLAGLSDSRSSHPYARHHVPYDSRSSMDYQNADHQYIADQAPFEIFVTNINYNSTKEELFYSFGGEEGGVLSVVLSEEQGHGAKRGTATVTFNSREALLTALKCDRMELQGRVLRVSPKHRQQRGASKSRRDDYRNDNLNYGTYGAPAGQDGPYGQYRSNSYAGVNSMVTSSTAAVTGNASLPPRPRGVHAGAPSSSSAYHGGGGGAGPGAPYAQYDASLPYVDQQQRPDLQRHPAYYDHKRADFGNRSIRYASNTLPNPHHQQQRRVSKFSRPYAGRHSMYETSTVNEQYHGSSYDISNRSMGRVRTDSMTSMPQTGAGGRVYHDEDQSQAQHQIHHERRKLELQPRTKPIGADDTDQPARKSSIFGEAKPVDTSEKERQAEERLRLEDEAFRKSSASSVRKLSGGEYAVSGRSSSSSYGAGGGSGGSNKVVLMKSASHDGVHGMVTKQNSLLDEPLIEEMTNLNTNTLEYHNQAKPPSYPGPPSRSPSRTHYSKQRHRGDQYYQNQRYHHQSPSPRLPPKPPQPQLSATHPLTVPNAPISSGGYSQQQQQGLDYQQQSVDQNEYQAQGQSYEPSARKHSITTSSNVSLSSSSCTSPVSSTYHQQQNASNNQSSTLLTNRPSSPASSFRSRSKDYVMVDSSNSVECSQHQPQQHRASKHGYNRTFTRSSFRANASHNKPPPQIPPEAATSGCNGTERSQNPIMTSASSPSITAANSTDTHRGSTQQQQEGGNARRGGSNRRGGVGRRGTSGGGGTSKDKKRRPVSREEHPKASGGNGSNEADRQQARRSSVSSSATNSSSKKHHQTRRESTGKAVDYATKRDNTSTKHESTTAISDTTKHKPEEPIAGKKEPSKKEKKKQAAKDMPKVEPKSINFSSQNKYAALLETDE
ncbi:unnamed protein product [Anisakis simplex]|uniref:RRM domain-containing protein n=1 Tax=Anisakis simplex TaxID=6269 RepID=A0A0M3K365_ANISI|nr:unnamed protein product [Anisakis simplex]